MQNQQKWYQQPATVVVFLIFFFPVGLYLMWKNDLWSKNTRIIISVFFGLLVLGNLNNESSPIKEGQYRFEENGISVSLYLSKPDLNSNSEISEPIGFAQFGMNLNGDVSIVKGKYLLNSKGAIVFKWENGIGPEWGIYSKEKIEVVNSEGKKAIYKYIGK